MRIVAVADTHLYQNDLGDLPDGDVFVHCGDFLRGGSLDELARFVPWLIALPHRHKVVVAGNHDCCFESAPGDARALLPPDVIYLEDSGAEIDGVRFWGSPWQPAYHSWAFNLPRGPALAARWAEIPRGTEVLITHGPPQGFGDRTPVTGRHGCADLRERVRAVSPRLHLFGHIHQDGGFWRDGETAFANATTWECERGPTVLELTSSGVTPCVVPPSGR